MKQINDKLLSFASTLEDEALHQAIITSHLPFIHAHVALMPDAHYGLGSTIGSVIPTVGAVVPAAVGVDIGCGMIAVKTQLMKRDLAGRDLAVLRHSIEHSVPLSVGKGNKTITESAQRRIEQLETKAKARATKQYAQFADWRHQLGSLGSGNHFIEVSLDEDDNVWLFLHSGSRGVGNKIAQHHIKIAQAVCKRCSVHLEDPDLAYLTDQTDEFHHYIYDLLWAQDFALANREEIMDRVLNDLAHFVHGDIQELERINCLAGETRVITKTGIRDIKSLAGSKHELLTAGGEWVEAPVCSFGKQHLMKVELSRNGVKNTIYATAEHRWLLRTHGETGSRYAGSREEKITSELVQGDRLAYVFATQQSMSIVQEAAARGFVYGDGSHNGRKSHANFCGDKDEALLGLFANYLPPREYENFKRINGLPLEWKTERPSLGVDASYLYSWLAGYFAADGDVDMTGRPTLWSSSLENLEYVRDLCMRIGVGTYGVRVNMRVGYGTSKSPIYLLGFMRKDVSADFFLIPVHRGRFTSSNVHERRGWTVVSVSPTDRYEEVYCAVVDSTHSFALEDNILTGNCHHNFTKQEHHFGKEVWLTRKGAIEASVGELGLIPGSMGTRSYVVEGKGFPLSFNSAPHGAGRAYSRRKARATFTFDDLKKAMAGIEFRQEQVLIDEIPQAYKDIDQVMEDARDLVGIRHTLRQLLNVKGD